MSTRTALTTAKQALAKASAFADFGVSWFEEPVSSDDLEGLRLIRESTPPGMRIAAGEYGYDAFYFRRMLQAGAVDVLQADATRCAGITGFLCRRESMRIVHNSIFGPYSAVRYMRMPLARFLRRSTSSIFLTTTE